MKFSVSLYSFFSALRAGEITLLECVDKAKEMGFEIGRASCRERV